MLIKVCGIADSRFVQHLNEIDMQMVGFIFYPQSKRFVNHRLCLNAIAIPESVKKVGVFVNEEMEQILFYNKSYHFDFIQLHGNESVNYCEKLKTHVKIIKAFGIDEHFDFSNLASYELVADYFLFDTKSSEYGGTGSKFQWENLENYRGNTPFLLSGGIQPDDVEDIKHFRHPQFAGIDINSGFEISPGIKDIQKVKTFINALKS